MNRLRVAILATTFLVGACSESNDPDSSYEALPENQATAQAAVDRATTGSQVMPASCTGAITINCPNGTPGTLGFTLTRANVTLTPVTARSFSYTAQAAVTTAQDIPLNVNGAACGLDIETAPGASPNITISGTVTFVTPPSGSSPNRVDVTAAVSGLEAADLNITGTSVNCATLDLGIGAQIGLLEDSLEREFHFCGARGADLLVECPATLVIRE
jgi:hypothetical protein